MSKNKTNEFSICLRPTREIIEEVKKVRTELPLSPYRDDPPHVTLVRGITSSNYLDDGILFNTVASITQIAGKLPLKGIVTDIANKGNDLYSSSGLLIITPSDSLKLYRNYLLNSLKSGNFSDESQDKNTHDLHITIRLGVELDSQTIYKLKEQFIGKQISFNDWFILRLELDDGARKMHEVNIGSIL